MASTLAAVTSSYTAIEFQPLTTPWSVPNDCSSSYFAPAGTGWATMSAFWPQYGEWVNTDLQCLPSAMTPVSLSSNLESATITSLGPFVCPTGWTVATTATEQLGTLTMTMCCPSGWGKNLNGGTATVPGTCHSNLKTSSLAYAVMPTDTASVSSYPWSMTTRTAIKTDIMVRGYPIWGYNDGAAPSAASSGLSTGAKAGIGVGVGVGALIIIALLVFWFLRRRRNKNKLDGGEAARPAEADTEVVAASELESRHTSTLPAEADSQAGGGLVSEKKSDIAPSEAAELQTHDNRVEMEGSVGPPPTELASQGHRFELEG